MDGEPKSLSILIILMGSLGDVARGLAIVDQIKRNFPNCKITWLVERKYYDLVSLNSYIDEILVFERNQGIFGIAKILSTFLFKGKRFDITLDLQRHFKSGIFSWLSRAPRRIGFHRKDAKEFNWLFNNEHIPYFGVGISKLSHYLEFVKYLGGSIFEPLNFGICAEDKKSVNLPANFIGVVLGSSWGSKDWFLEGYDRLLKLIFETNNFSVVLLGDKTQKSIADTLVKKFSSNLLVDFVGKTNLGGLVSIISRSKICVGPDSGPGHIAAALKIPYISLFGPTLPERVAPYGNEDLVIHSAIGCSPCNRRVCPGLNKLCMRLISPEVVYAKLLQVAKQ